MNPAAVWRPIALALPPCLAALYPLVFVLQSHSTTHVFSMGMVLRPAGVLVGFALLVLIALRRALGEAAPASVAATLFFALLGLFPVAFNVRAGHDNWLLSLAFTIAAFALALVLLRFVEGFPGIVICWTVTAVVGWALTSTVLVSTATWPAPSWEHAVRRILTAARAHPLPHSGPKPDIYYIILDGMGRADVLERVYGLDATPAIQRLEALGAAVPRAARSNYSQTQLSLASALNMQYLDPLGPVMGDALDRRPVNRLIVESGATGLLQQHGYELVVVTSDASITFQHRAADRCLCVLPFGPTELEHTVFSITPLQGRYLDRSGMAAHREGVMRWFALLESTRSDRPMVMLAHVVSPHPPFVLDADGTARIGQERFTFYDGDAFPGSRDEYITGYRAQATFILERVTTLVERIVARSPGAVIVVLSDHGPGLGLVNTDLSRTDAWERLGIFSAYYPGVREGIVPEDMSPVNAFRWALSTGLGARIELLPNRSYLSDYVRPYRWTEVAPER